MDLIGKPFAGIILAIFLASAAGCGGNSAEDANKNLKPVDPNAPKPAAVGAGAGAGAGAGVVQ